MMPTDEARIERVVGALKVVGFDDPETRAHPEKAIIALAETLNDREAELLALRDGLDRALGLKWTERPVCMQGRKDAERLARVRAARASEGRRWTQ